MGPYSHREGLQVAPQEGMAEHSQQTNTGHSRLPERSFAFQAAPLLLLPHITTAPDSNLQHPSQGSQQESQRGAWDKAM